MRQGVARGVARALTACAVLLAGTVHAGQLNLRHYDTPDGVPQSQVTSVHQDRYGYVWVATYGGLARYNGDRFEAFRQESGLNTTYINVVSSSESGVVWTGTSHGLCRSIDPSRSRFECFNPERFDSLMVNDLMIVGDTVWAAGDEGVFVFRDGRFDALRGWPASGHSLTALSLVRDDRGDVWIGGQSGLYRWADGTLEVVALPVVEPSVHGLRVHEGNLWVGTQGRLFRVEGDRPSITEIDLPLPGKPSLYDIEFDTDGTIWLATGDGLLRGTPDQLERLVVADGLPNDRLLDIMQDREGLVWLGTDQGLVKILPGPFEGYTADSGLLASFVRTINEDRKRRLWLGTREGIQIVPWKDGRWELDQSTTILSEDGLPDRRVNSVIFDDDDAAWIATAQGVVRWEEGRGVTELIDRQDGLPDSEVHSLLIDRSGRLWIGSAQGVRYLEDGRLRVPGHAVLAKAWPIRIRQDESGRLWFATLRDGLLVLETDGSFMQYTAAEGLSDEVLWDIAPGSDGSMWVGSNGDGVFRVWPDGRIRQFTSQDGLPNDSVWQLLEDRAGRLWAYTNRGLARMDAEGFRNYDLRDGLLHLEGGATGAFQSSDGMLWFASADGLMRYEATGEYRNDRPPPTLIESVMLDHVPVQPGATLPFRSGSLVLRYAGLSFQDESAVRFKYRLVGASDRWSPPTDSRQITYANLGHGSYRFEVMAANPDGLWSEQPALFEFQVEKPFWAKSWFIVLAILATLGLVMLGVHLRLRRIQALRRRLQNLVKQRTFELRKLNRQLKRAARTDPLTGLPNRRYLFDRIGEDLARSHRARFEGRSEHGDIAFLMVDIDHFKQVNDQFGHDAGDRILRAFSQALQSQLRETDYMIRWGGEEFLVVACQTDADYAHKIAERLLAHVRESDFTLKESDSRMRVTCSVGIATYPFTRQEVLDWEQVAELADVAVYRAKVTGRDRWVQLMPGSSLSIDEPVVFMKAVRENLDGLIANGRIRCRDNR